MNLIRQITAGEAPQHSWFAEDTEAQGTGKLYSSFFPLKYNRHAPYGNMSRVSAAASGCLGRGDPGCVYRFLVLGY